MGDTDTENHQGLVFGRGDAEEKKIPPLKNISWGEEKGRKVGGSSKPSTEVPPEKKKEEERMERQ